ncbi:DNA mismatch repair protein mutS/MSH [Fadolivirus algeromassiliense]|jgi:DNA mismatch repair protein MutS|uniref:DNA mismatch repair protein mutS/MSH n=1 Tax=Fadolivirus FV1/VV64 TaxID=3070911 RepID=A0A7D3QVQ1_9VIRU|nr:DNA mismatch repair protein mutS/MSH [Fadolivirus algeromassiliense]QKF93779.1 DNA mismatch repair protein mutS/MSH [Fadolivirus FV1/VV64]
MSKNILQEYFFYQEKYSKLYGNNTIVFMRIGDFYEAYATETKGFELSRIAEVTNLAKTKRDKKIEQVDDKNPYMMGFQYASLHKFLKLMVDNCFTVVIVDQITPAPNPKRAVTGIYSAGTYINDNDTIDSNNIVCIYIEDEKQMSGNYLTCIGLSSVDLTTGECSVYEVCSILGDEKYALDEAYRFIISNNPKEVIITRKEIESISMKKDTLISYLELDNKNIHYITNQNLNKNFYKLSYQNDFFGKIYKSGMMSPIEYIDMEKMYYARISLITLFDYAYKHNESFINNLDKPSVFTNTNHLILGNNAIYQLNILESNSMELNNVKFKSLFDVINHTSTAMGRRFMKQTICQPLTDINEIQLRYDCVEELLENDLYQTLEKHLEYILDIERLGRKVFLNIIHPYEFANLIESFNEIDNIYKLTKESKYLSKYSPHNKLINQVNEFLEFCNKTFDMNELKKQNLNDITGSFYIKGVYPQIDELNDKVVNNIQIMEDICQALSTYVDDTNKFTKKKKAKLEEDNDDKENSFIKLKKNERDGYYLALTKRRADMLKNKLKTLEVIEISETLKIQPDKLLFKDAIPNKQGKYSDTKIFFTDLNDKSNDVIHLKEKLIGIVKKKYIDLLGSFGTKYKDMFRILSQFISRIDFLKSNAKTAKMYNYCKPVVIENLNNGYMNAINMRHPIAERLRTDIEYIPHNIKLGKPVDYKNGDNLLEGILLYGLNSAGKSTYMKACGLNQIMAQCGMYVAAEQYEYSPYESIFARITGSDNIFKGLSQFGLEMTELRAILKRNGPKTLVIGDEVCRGTEHISGNCIVATTIIMLANTGCSFIFATHLHEIANMERIKNLNNVKTFHLTVEYDSKNDMLIFDRLLKEGSGSSIYGLTVAKYIIKDDEFIKLAQDIMNELLDQPNELLTDKSSKYNSQVYVDTCQVCGKKNTTKEHVGMLDVHHINFQSNCNENGFVIGKSHIPMNNKCNLVVLCKSCHYKVHHDELEINGYKDTTNGIILDYKKTNENEFVISTPKKINNKINKVNNKKQVIVSSK